MTILLAGVFGETVFELYAWVISPAVFGVTLEPTNLVVGLSQTFLALDLTYWQGFALHMILGAAGFPITVYAVARLLGGMYLLSGILTGLALWFVAQGMLAPLMGRSFMMGFGAYTQSSFVGHVGMTLVIGAVFARAWAQSTAPNKA